MPSLPELEVYRKKLATMVGPKVTGVEAIDYRVVRADINLVEKELLGKSLRGIGRYGKWIWFETGGTDLVFHLGLTGKLKQIAEDAKKPGYDCFEIHFEDGQRLAVADQRHLGKIYLRNFEEIREEKKLGPDLLTMTEAEFVKTLTARKRARDGLMDQKKIAGIGGKYADEILWQARIHPNVRLSDLDDDKRRELYRLTMEITKKAIELDADVEQFPESWLIPHRRGDKICPNCGGPITGRTMGGSEVFYCPADQPPPVPIKN